MPINGPKINFTFLNDLSSTHIVAVSPEKTLQICVAESSRGCEILRLWTRKLLGAYGISNITRAIWTMLCRLFNEILKGLLSKENCATDLMDWLKECCDLLNTTKNSLNLFNQFILVNFALQTVRDVFQYYSRSNVRYCALELKVVLNLYNSAVKILNTSLENVELEDIEMRSIYINAFELLCIVGEIKTYLPPSSTEITWKCISALVIAGAQIPELHYLAERPLRYMLSEVALNWEYMFKKDSHKNDRQITYDYYSRLNNMYLLNVKEITNYFQHQSFPAIEEFFNLYSIKERVITFIIKSTYYNTLQYKLINLINEVFALVFKHPGFNKMILADIDNLPVSVAEDYRTVMRKTPDVQFIGQQKYLFKKLFEKALSAQITDIARSAQLRINIMFPNYAVPPLKSSQLEQ